jgi:hypothetical protein
MNRLCVGIFILSSHPRRRLPEYLTCPRSTSLPFVGASPFSHSASLPSHPIPIPIPISIPKSPPK